MAYDAESDRIVLFGGWSGFQSGSMDDTWAYDFNTNTWTNRNLGTRPSPRGAHAMVYDAESDRIILFGGTEGPETWAYDYNTNTWTNMSPAVQPDAWYFVDMAYDAESDRIVLFGGCAGDSFFTCLPFTRGETWAYDYNVNTWTNLNPGPTPSPRHAHRMAYDTGSDRIVLFGGILGTDVFNLLPGTWAYDYNANSWTEMNPEEAPPRTDTHDMAYDPKADRIVHAGSIFVSEATWAYDFDSDTWIHTDTGPPPSVRAGTRLAYDSESERMVLFGGLSGSFPNLFPNNETWAHHLVPTPPVIDWVSVAIVSGVVAAAVAVAAVFLTRRRRRMQRGQRGS